LVAGAIHVALVDGRAALGIATHANTAHASVGLAARVAVIAGHAIGLGRIGAKPRALIARPRIVALIGGGADHRIATRAHPGLATVGLRARIAVIARSAVGLRRIRARARRRIARARIVALVARRAGHGVASRADTRLADVRQR